MNLASVRSQSDFPIVMLTCRYERGCFIFDYMTDEEVHLWSENDLNFLSLLGPLVSSQPVNEIGSHKSALQATATCESLIQIAVLVTLVLFGSTFKIALTSDYIAST